MVAGAVRAVTRSWAPMPVRFDFVPTRRILIQLRFSGRVAAQQLRQTVDAVHDDVDVAVVVVVAKGTATGRDRRVDTWAAQFGYVFNWPLRRLR